MKKFRILELCFNYSSLKKLKFVKILLLQLFLGILEGGL